MRLRRQETDPQTALRQLEIRVLAADARLRGLRALEQAFQSVPASDDLEAGVERSNHAAIAYATEVVEGMLRYYVEDVRTRGLVSERLDRLAVRWEVDRTATHG